MKDSRLDTALCQNANILKVLSVDLFVRYSSDDFDFKLK